MLVLQKSFQNQVSGTVQPVRWYFEDEAAAALKVAAATLRTWRNSGDGPRWSVRGMAGAVVYLGADLITWQHQWVRRERTCVADSRTLSQRYEEIRERNRRGRI